MYRLIRRKDCLYLIHAAATLSDGFPPLDPLDELRSA
jgi:hypothetical protein